MTVGVAEFSLPDASALSGLTYEKARALAGSSWRVLERTSLLSKSGQKSECHYPIASGTPAALPAKGQPPPADPTPERRSEKFEVEVQIDKEGESVELEFVFDRQQPDAATPKRFDANEKMVLRNEEATLLHATAQPAAKGAKMTTVRALIARARIVDERGERPPPKPEPPPPSHHQ